LGWAKQCVVGRKYGRQQGGGQVMVIGDFVQKAKRKENTFDVLA
jgi:hypothetical protein